MVDLDYKVVLLGERTKQKICVAVIDDRLPVALQPQSHVVHGGEVVHRIATWLHGVVEQFVTARAAGFFGVAVETLLEGVPGGRTVPRYARCRALVFLDGNESRPLGHEEQYGEQVGVGLLPTLTFLLRIGRTWCAVDDEKHRPRVKAKRLAEFPRPIAKTPRSFPLADVV